VLLACSFVFSQLVVLLILRMPAVPGEGSWLQAFRGYFSFDQLSYAGIASTAAAGDLGLPEPFTETGNSYYPSLWYRTIGWIAGATGMSVPAVWTILGYLLFAVCVAVIGFIAYRISRLAWSPALVGPALCIGTLSVVLDDQWFTPLESHALLWGPYGALYPLNAEVAGFALLGMALAIVLRVALTPTMKPSSRVTLLTLSAALVGVTANLQTYVFFVGAAVLFAWAGIFGLLRSRSRLLAGISGGIVIATFLLGPTLAEHLGALPVYSLLIACTLPGALWLARRALRAVALPILFFVLAAAPQALIVAGGILSKDEFLTYRQGSSGALGVSIWSAALASLPIAAIWLANLAVQRRHRNDAVLASLLALAFAGVMLTFNGAWGFSQEPYRLWIDSVTVTALVLAPITAWSIARARTDRPEERTSLVRYTALVAVLLFVVALVDFGAYRAFVKESGVIRFDTDRYRALAELTVDVDGLMTNGPCIDAQEMKIVTRKPVTYYNLGIAWPADKPAIDAVMDARRSGDFDPNAMRAAKVKYLVTDTGCSQVWPIDGAMGSVELKSLDYADETGSGTLTLWLLA